MFSFEPFDFRLLYMLVSYSKFGPFAWILSPTSVLNLDDMLHFRCLGFLFNSPFLEFGFELILACEGLDSKL